MGQHWVITVISSAILLLLDNSYKRYQVQTMIRISKDAIVSCIQGEKKIKAVEKLLIMRKNPKQECTGYLCNSLYPEAPSIPALFFPLLFLPFLSFSFVLFLYPVQPCKCALRYIFDWFRGRRLTCLKQNKGLHILKLKRRISVFLVARKWNGMNIVPHPMWENQATEKWNETDSKERCKGKRLRGGPFGEWYSN